MVLFDVLGLFLIVFEVALGGFFFGRAAVLLSVAEVDDGLFSFTRFTTVSTLLVEVVIFRVVEGLCFV